ncbi:hypothetical protein BH23CHL2_BH23CHL2_02940 [soil metagenome]
MKSIRTALFLGILLSASATVPAAAQVEETGVIFGQIINGTTDEPVPEIAVTLSTFAGGTLQAGSNTITDDQGRFEFTGVESNPEAVHAVSTSFFGIAYSTGRISFEPDSVGIDVTLDVYEPTEDQSLVTVFSRGLILTDVEPTRGEIGLLDIYLLGINEDRVLVANDEGRALVFPVPRNASRVTPLSDPTYDLQTASIEGATIYGTEPLLPGETTATLSYTVPYIDDRVSVELRAAYQTNLFRILVPLSISTVEDAIGIEASGFEYVGQEVIGPQTYDVWARDDVAAGDRINVTYTQLVRSQIQPNTLNKIVPISIANAAALAAIAIVVWVVRSRRLDRERPVVLAPQLASSLEAHRTDLIDQLRALELAHEQGVVDESEYPDYRRFVLEQIRQVNRQMRGEGVED